MITIQSSNRLRYGMLANLQSQNVIRYSTSLVQSPYNRTRYASTRSVTSLARLRYMATSAEFDQIYKYGAASDPDSLPQVSIKADGTELCPAPYVMQVTHTESGAARWTIGIKDPIGYYHPKNILGSPWAGKLTGNKKSMLARVTWEGAEYSMHGKSTSYGHARNFTSAGSFDFTWSGIDNSSPLFATGKTMATARTKGATIWTTKSAVAALLTEAGIPYNLDLMEDTPIRLQHRQDGRIGDWFQALLDVLWHKWIMVGGILYVYKPNYLGPATWRYGNEAFILEDSLQSDQPTFTNQVTARRAKEANGGSSAPVEHDTFGQFTQTFNPPLEGIFWKKKEQGGVFSDFRLYSNGSLIAVREARGSLGGALQTATSGTIDKVVYTWGATAGQFATGGYGKIQFYGAGQDASDSVFAQDSTYSITRKNTTSIDNGDEINTVELAPSTLIGDGTILQRHADGYLYEQAANQEPIDYRFPLNMLMFPGQRVLIEDPILGSEKRYIRGVTHSFSDDPANRFTRAQTVAIPSINIVTV